MKLMFNKESYSTKIRHQLEKGDTFLITFTPSSLKKEALLCAREYFLEIGQENESFYLDWVSKEKLTGILAIYFILKENLYGFDKRPRYEILFLREEDLVTYLLNQNIPVVYI